MKVGGGGEASAVTVAVAVKSAEGRGSQRAVRWAVENLMPTADRLILVHVMPSITSVPTPSGGSIPVKELDENLSQTYIQDVRAKCKENIRSFEYQYRKHKMETVILEGDNPASSLLRYISDAGTTCLVLGSYSSNYFTRKLNDSAVPSIVLKHAPDTCEIYVISANKLVSNSLNPLSTKEREHDSHAFSKQESNLSSSSTESRFRSCQSDISQTDTQGHSLQYATQENSEDNFSTMSSIARFPSLASTSSPRMESWSEIERLRLELENTVSLYKQACEDIIHAQNRVQLLTSECIQESQRVNAAQEREESLRRMAAEEKNKYLEAEREVEMAKKLLAKETYDRQIAELKAQEEELKKRRIVDELFSSDRRYRRYTRDDILAATFSFAESKIIGEGGYGKVYKGSLDHTFVAIKVLRPDAADRKEEFLREVEVLSQLRHPHIVLLLGACPELGCLVYEYMDNGSLEEHIMRRRGRPSLPWPIRFRIAFEIARGLAFLHHTKPKPIVHRDLKPGNILLDKNYMSKIGDVGLAKMIYDDVPDNITEYKDSVIAGTLNYLDPEYQRTGTLRPKSDLYSFGVIILQLLSARHPNGLIMKFENAVGQGKLADILDNSVADWPLGAAEKLVQIALKCCKLRCRDRPDLETEVLPVLREIIEFADSRMERDQRHASKHYYCPILQEIMENPYIAADGFTYEHEAIKAWLQRQNVSPVTKQPLQHKMLFPDHMLRSAIQEWKQHTSSQRT